jgi:uncharacterized membrane protein
MPDRLLVPLTITSAVGAAVAGGVFFAFSAFVMKALHDLPPAQGLTAMQSINRAAPTAPFMLVLFGTALICVALGVVSLRHLDETVAVYRLVGGALYLVAVVLTVVYHVPRNDALATVDPAGVDAARKWLDYLSGWTAWNHVRSITSIAGAVAFTLAIRVGERVS